LPFATRESKEYLVIDLMRPSSKKPLRDGFGLKVAIGDHHEKTLR